MLRVGQYKTTFEQALGYTVVLVDHYAKIFIADESCAVSLWQWWAEQAQRGGSYCGLERSVFLIVQMALRPVRSSDDMHERNEGVERTCAAKSPEHVFP